MISDNSLSPKRTLGDFLRPDLREASSDAEVAPPPLTDRHFLSLGGGCGGAATRGRAGRWNRGHQSRCRRLDGFHPRRDNSKPSATTVPVADQPTSWADRCSSTKVKAWSPRALTYFAPTLKNGIKVAVCPLAEVAKAAANWDRVLMGYFLGLKPYVLALARYLKLI